MKIITKVGNLLTNINKGHMVHGCNAQGVMGSGFAKSLKEMYPLAFKDYRDIYEDEGLDLGMAYPYMPSEELVIWNAITQEGFGQPTRNCSYDAIQECFAQINEAMGIVTDLGIVQEIHIPFLGAGLGGGSWNIIKAIIEDTVSYPITVWSINGRMPDGSLVDSTE